MAAIPFSPPNNPNPKLEMANYYATARSNYFAVKDETAFREWADRTGLDILEPCHRGKVSDGIRRFGITPKGDGDSGSWPTDIVDEEADDCVDIDLADELSKHLVAGEVAVLMEIGSEKLRYVSGFAVAVNHKGRCVRLDLDSIYAKASRLGGNITRAEY